MSHSHIMFSPNFYLKDHYYRLYIYYLYTFRGRDANDEKEEPSEIGFMMLIMSPEASIILYGMPVLTQFDSWSIKFAWQRFDMIKLLVLTRQERRYEVTQLHSQVDLCSKEFNELPESTMRVSNRYDGPSIQTSMGTNHLYLSIAGN